MDYYAKSENNFGHKELLIDHLKKVSELCAEYGKDFEEEELCRQLGLLHDAGKCTNLFQDVLCGKEKGVNHSLLGGQLMLKKNNIIPCVLTGHHTELDLLKTRKNLMSLKEGCPLDADNLKIAYPNKDEKRILTDFLKLENFLSFHPMIDASYTNNELMFFIRMIYSCLVDADFSASAELNNPNYLKNATGIEIDYDYLLKRLADYKYQIMQQSNANSEMNILREQVYNDCTISAKQDTGLFILTAPTGTGKTLATLKFALEHGQYNNKKKIFFVLPYLSIINQNVLIYKEICGNEYILEDTSQNKFSDLEREFSERWSSPITMLTSVKFFEALFQNKNTKCRKLHNLANSIIVFDEAQSLPPTLLDATLEIMNFLVKKFNTTVVFSTATQPAFDVRKNVNWKPKEIILNPQKLYDDYARVKQLDIEWNINNEISFNSIAENIKNENNACVIVNRKDHAKELYNTLKEKIDSKSLFYISTNMAPEHRINTIREIKQKLSNGEKCILVSTQCIEAGVDLSFDVIYRALAPLEAIIQASGRCNRNGNKKGKLVVFVPDAEKKYPSVSYENSALQVKIILKEKDININDLNDIYNYYKKFFKSSSGNHDKEKLVNAIAEQDFNKTQKEYKIIENEGCNIIVPYGDSFNDIKENINDRSCIINKGIMKDFAHIAISCYDEEFCKQYCQELYLRKSDGTIIESGWYLLDNVDFYDTKIGLVTDNDVNFIL